jgi:hypothetical protein
MKLYENLISIVGYYFEVSLIHIFGDHLKSSGNVVYRNRMT